MTDTASPPADDAGEKPEQLASENSQTVEEIAAETLGVGLLEAMTQEFENGTAWKGMTELQRQTVIDRFRARIETLVAETLRILFVGDYPAVKAKLDSITVKDGVKAALKIAGTEHHLVELMERAGQPVVVLMVDPQQHLDRMHTVRAKRDQGDLFDKDGYLKTAKADAQQRQESTDGTATGDGSGEALPPLYLRALWVQACKQLETIGIRVDTEVAQAWTEEQTTEVAYWVKMVTEKGHKAPPAPKFIPLPEKWNPKGWKKA